MPRRLIVAECLLDYAPRPLIKLLARQFHFDLAVVSTLASTLREPRVDVGRSGNGHPVAPFWLYSRVAHHAEDILERQQTHPSRLGRRVHGFCGSPIPVCVRLLLAYRRGRWPS
jgi:hypothetical protein